MSVPCNRCQKVLAEIEAKRVYITVTTALLKANYSIDFIEKFWDRM